MMHVRVWKALIRSFGKFPDPSTITASWTRRSLSLCTTTSTSASASTSNYAPPTPPSSIPLSKFLSLFGMFPLLVRQSYRDYRSRHDHTRAQHNLLRTLPFYPLQDSKGRLSKVISTSVGDGNFINEFVIYGPNLTSTPNHLVIVHGYGAGLGFFLHNLDAASSLDNWIVHAVDLLGYGCSLRPPFISDYNNKDRVLAWFHDSFDKWLTAREIPRDRTMVMAHSMGAYLMATFGIDRDPNFCKKIIMVSPGAVCNHRPVPVPRYFAYLWEQNILPFLLVRASGVFGSKLVSGWSSRRFARFPENEQTLFHRYAYSIFLAPGLGEYMLNCLLAPGAQPRHPLILQNLQNVNCQWRWWYGEHDWMDSSGGHEASRLINQQHSICRSSVTRVPDSGHHLYLDNPKRFNSLLLEEMKSFNAE